MLIIAVVAAFLWIMAGSEHGPQSALSSPRSQAAAGNSNLLVYAVNKKVSDFPTNEDLSTPETQGSGKSLSMVFFAQKELRKVAGNWTFVVVTGRVELDDQIAKTFKATCAVSEAEGDQCHAESGVHLRELLRGNHRYVFTLMWLSRPQNSATL